MMIALLAIQLWYSKPYADGSTEHPIEHLATHCMTEAGLMPAIDGNTSMIRQAFGNSALRIQFNAGVFPDLLIRLLITCNLPFQCKCLYRH